MKTIKSVILLTLLLNIIMGCDKKSSTDNAPPSKSGQQKIIYTNQSYKYKYSSEECGYECFSHSDPYIKNEAVNEYLSKGWRVVSSSPREKPGTNGCLCIGTEYVIEK